MDQKAKEQMDRIEAKLDLLLSKLEQAEQLFAVFSNGTGAKLMTMLGGGKGR